MKVEIMCYVIMTETGDVDSPAEMEKRGWIVTPDDVLDNYLEHRSFDVIVATSCLCPIRVEQVLKRHGVEFTRDPFGWCVAPLRGEYEH